MSALRKNDIQVLTDVEHVLTRPGMYCGSPIEEPQNTYLYEDNKIIKKEIPIIPGLCKIIDEVIDNSVDEAIRTKFEFATKIEVSFDGNEIIVRDNGRGLPIVQDKETKKWIPEIIFTQLRAGSNFDDTNRATIGMNGVGSSLTAIFSKVFNIDTANGAKRYTQTIENSLAIKSKPKISESPKNYTEISFTPNYDFFNTSELAKSYLSKIIYRRLKNLAFCYPEITFYYNKEKISATKLKQYLESIHSVYEMSETVDSRLGIFYSEDDFSQMSFVNGAYTSRGGSHVDFVTNRIVQYIVEYIKKKHKFDVKTADVKSKLFLILSIRMNAPKFDSQTKERLISSNNEIKGILEELITEKFLKSLLKNEEIILPIIEAYKLQQQVKENVKLQQLNKVKKIKVAKYHPAVKSPKYLFLTEGDSACGGLMAAFGREFYSYFPLKGKPLNSLEVSINKISENEELKNIIQILNLRLDKDIQNNISHENIVFAADQDLDGTSIKALMKCFFFRFAPSLIKANRIKYLRTPLLVAKKNGKIVEIFFDLKSYRESNLKGVDFEYKKGLGSWKRDDLKDLIKKYGVDYFIQDFEYDDGTDEALKGWMSKDTVAYRKAKVRGKQFDISTI
jgi:DNA gyrase/topoisomerase IV subunit B